MGYAEVLQLKVRCLASGVACPKPVPETWFWRNTSSSLPRVVYTDDFQNAIGHLMPGWSNQSNYSKTCVKRSQIGYHLYECRSYSRPSVIKIFVLSIFEWPFYSGFTVLNPEQRLFTNGQ